MEQEDSRMIWIIVTVVIFIVLGLVAKWYMPQVKTQAMEIIQQAVGKMSI